MDIKRCRRCGSTVHSEIGHEYVTTRRKTFKMQFTEYKCNGCNARYLERNSYLTAIKWVNERAGIKD